MGRAKRDAADGEKFVAAVEAIYGAATAPDQWPFALQAVADVFGDVGANLTYRRDDGGFGAIVSPALLAGIEDYNREWYRHDIRSARAAEQGYFISRDVITDQDVASEHEIATHPFYAQFLAKFGLRWFAGVNISPAPNVAVAISVQRSGSKQPFGPGECATLLRLAKHAEQSLRLSMRLIEADVANAGLRDVLARFGFGVFILDSVGRVLFGNAAGRRLLGQGLALVEERLSPGDRSGKILFEESLAEILRGDCNEAFAEPRPILLPRADTHRPLALFLLPLRSSLQPDLDQFLVNARAIVLVIDVDAQSVADPALVRDLLGVTLGEARVAALVATGMPPREVAAKLDITEETARTVLKRVYAKAGVSRQSELANLVGKLTLGA